MGDITVASRLAAPAGPSSGATGWCGAVHGSALTHEEMEFIAEEERVQIVPLFSSPRLTLLGGEVGPFRAQIPVVVPLWIAVALKTKSKANILPPAWLEVAALEEVLRLERSSEAEFQPLPFHYVELATALFKHASDAFGERRQRVYDLVESIRSVRFNKIEKGLKRLDGANAIYIRLNNVAAMEVNLVRPFLVTALNRFAHHAASEAAAERGALAAAAAAGRAANTSGAEGDRPRRQLRR